MTLAVIQTSGAIGPGNTASFLGTGGTEPYAYSVLPGGAGGTIDSDGVYTAPSVLGQSPTASRDTVRVTDAADATIDTSILVGNPLLLFCDILQHEMGLSNGRVFLWDQKLMQPKDDGLYVAVSVPSCRPFSNINRPSTDGTASEQMVSMLAVVDVDLISRGPAARDQKEGVLWAVGSDYAQRQQQANGFYIARLSGRFVNLSDIDGAAIPYRYRISFNMQYAAARTSSALYFDSFSQENTIDN